MWTDDRYFGIPWTEEMCFVLLIIEMLKWTQVPVGSYFLSKQLGI